MDTVVTGLIAAAAVTIVVAVLLAWQARRNGSGRRAEARSSEYARREADDRARAADHKDARADALEAKAGSERETAAEEQAEAARLREEAGHARSEAEDQQRRADEVDPVHPATSGQVGGSPEDDMTTEDHRRGRHRR